MGISRRPLLQSDRIRIREIDDTEDALVASWRSDPLVYSGFIEFAPASARTQHDFMANVRAGDARSVWMIEAIEGSQAIPVGNVGIMGIDRRNRRCEFGPIFIGEHSYRGRGLALEAERLVLDYCFLHLGMHRVYAYVTEPNAAVVAFHEKAGFRRETALREHIFMDGRFWDLIVLSLLEDEHVPFS